MKNKSLKMTAIIVLNYNTFQKSCVCIDSCLKQKGTDYRILLIDNCSTDDSYQRLKQLYSDKIDYFQTGSNYGYAGGNNRGVRYVIDKGYKYALLLNSDTELVGECLLKSLVTIAENNRSCAVVAPTIFDVTKNGLVSHTNDYVYNKLLRKVHVLPVLEQRSDNLVTVSEAHGSALLVDCERFIEVGGFPEHYFMYCEESTFAKKIIWRGYNILWSRDKANFIYHHHDKSGAVAPWRVFLMGRNRAVEFYENYHHQSWLWRPLYYVFKIKMFIDGWRSGNMHYYHGMISGQKLYKQKSSKQQIYEHGVHIMNSLK